MNLTDAMRGWARKHLGLAESATDEQIRAALGQALAENRLTESVWQELKANRTPDARALVQELVTQAVGPLLKDVGEIKTVLARLAPAGASGGGAAGSGQGGTATAPPPTPAAGQQPPAGDGTKPDELFSTHVKSVLTSLGIQAGGTQAPPGDTPFGLLSRAAQAGWLQDPGNVRVKNPLERYDRSTKELRYPADHKCLELRGQRLTHPDDGPQGLGRPIDAPSQAVKALTGAWFKWQLCANSGNEPLPRWAKLTDHDRDLIQYAIHELPWTGTLGADPETGRGGTEFEGRKLADVNHRGVSGVKAVLDDSTSGGIQAAPIVIEDQLIITPLLYGELFPRVTVINLNRGRRVHAATIGRPTFTSGTPEGTPIPLFDTTNFIGTLDTTIFTAVGAMEIGLDFEEDSPADIGGTVIMEYGEAAKQWLDRVIAVGDGVSEPLGIMNAVGVTVVASANGTAGPLTVADAEALMFGIAKQYRVARGGKNTLIGNETSYRRFRQIPLGSTWENSRAFGADYGDYQVLGYPYAVVPLAPNNWVSFANLGFYRMYRRLGLMVRVETAGKTLALSHTKLIVCRMRMGGQPEQAGAFAVITDAAA